MKDCQIMKSFLYLFINNERLPCKIVIMMNDWEKRKRFMNIKTK